jgi:hypothetical protein
VTHGFVQKKFQRSCKDRANGNELFDMNSRENIWCEAMCFRESCGKSGFANTCACRKSNPEILVV